jgi:hypothetical protein
MSIWCSRATIGTDREWPRDEDDPPGDVRSYVDGWSNHYPTTDGTAEQPACIDTAHIAPWCVPGWWASLAHDKVGPWFRLSVDAPDTHMDSRGVTVGPWRHVSVVLDEAAVRSLVDELQSWLDTPKARPE